MKKEKILVVCRATCRLERKVVDTRVQDDGAAIVFRNCASDLHGSCHVGVFADEKPLPLSHFRTLVRMPLTKIAMFKRYKTNTLLSENSVKRKLKYPYEAVSNADIPFRNVPKHQPQISRSRWLLPPKFFL